MRRIVGALTMSVCAVFAAALLNAPSATANPEMRTGPVLIDSSCRTHGSATVCVNVWEGTGGFSVSGAVYEGKPHARPLGEGPTNPGVRNPGVHLVYSGGKPFGGEQAMATGQYSVQPGTTVQARASFTLKDGGRYVAAPSGFVTIP